MTDWERVFLKISNLLRVYLVIGKSRLPSIQRYFSIYAFFLFWFPASRSNKRKHSCDFFPSFFYSYIMCTVDIVNGNHKLHNIYISCLATTYELFYSILSECLLQSFVFIFWRKNWEKAYRLGYIWK